MEKSPELLFSFVNILKIKKKNQSRTRQHESRHQFLYSSICIKTEVQYSRAEGFFPADLQTADAHNTPSYTVQTAVSQFTRNTSSHIAASLLKYTS